MRELREKLKRLSIPQLKSLADNFEIDVSNCRRRNEFIDAIVASGAVLVEDVDTFLSLVGPEGGMEEEAKPVAGEETSFAAPPPSMERPPSPQPESAPGPALEEHLKGDIDFAAAHSHIQTLKDMFEKKKHRDIHAQVKKMITETSEMVKKIEMTGYAYILASTEHIINEIKMIGIDVGQAEKLLALGKTNFSKDLEATRKVITDLESEIERLKTEEVSKVEGKIREIESAISQAKQIEADVDEAELLMREVKTQFETRNFSECLRILQEVDEIVQEAHREKIQGITQLVLDVEDLIVNAKSIGAETEDAEKILSDAKNAFKAKEYVTCIENLTKVEEMVSSRLQAKLEEIEKLKEKQKAKIEKKLLALIDEASMIPDPDAASRIEDKFEGVKVALDENNITRATLLLREAEKELKAIRMTSPKEASHPTEKPVSPSLEAGASQPPSEKMPESRAVPPFQPSSSPQPQPELLPLQRPCKWCGYRGVEYYSTGVAKCPGCNRTYQWR